MLFLIFAYLNKRLVILIYILCLFVRNLNQNVHVVLVNERVLINAKLIAMG